MATQLAPAAAGRRLAPSRLTAYAYLELVRVDVIRLRGFRALRQLLRRTEINAPPADASEVIRAVIHAVETACILYVKPVHCLQQALVVTRLLRRSGVAADLVIGCTVLPMQAHAWVEAGGSVVSNEVFALDHYGVLDRW